MDEKDYNHWSDVSSIVSSFPRRVFYEPRNLYNSLAWPLERNLSWHPSGNDCLLHFTSFAGLD